MSALNSLNVLLVDDNQHMRAIVAAILKGAGVGTTFEVNDGSEALRMLRERPIDLAIVDFNMFPLDGVEFTRLVRNAPDSANPFLPIIMMTGHAERSRVVQARDAGVSEFVVKPVNAKVLMERLYAVVLKPRAFVRDETFVGPCRRRARRPDFEGPFRRRTDPKGMVEV